MFENFRKQQEIQLLARVENNTLHIATPTGYVLHLDCKENIYTLAKNDDKGGCSTILKNKLEGRKFDIVRDIIQLANNK